MIIRPANLEDISQIALLKNPKDETHRLTDELIARHRIENFDPSDQVLLVLEETEEIIGQIVIRFHGTETEPEYPNLQDLYIQNSHQGQGWGTKVISYCEKLLLQKGYAKIGVQVNPTLNCRAHKLYTDLGYHDLGREPYLDGIYDGDEDWVIDLVKNLT